MVYLSRILFSIIFICNAIVGYSQISISITGKILDQESKPVSSVYIVAINKDSSKFTTLSLDDGNFLMSIKSGYYTISGHYLGTLLFEKEIAVEADKDLGIITVIPTISLSEVVVRANKPLLKQIDDKLVFNVQNLSNITRYKVTDVLQYVPRLIVNPNGVLSVGGQSATIFVDDRQLSPEEAALFIKSMDAKDIKQVEVQTMRSGDQAADIMGGVIHIKTMSARIGLSGSVNIYASSPKKSYYHIFPGVNLFYGKEKWNIYGSYYYSNAHALQYSETINDYLESSIYHVSNGNYISNQNQNSYKIGSIVNLDKKHSIGIEFNGNVDNPKNNTSERNIWLYENNHLMSTGFSSTIDDTYSNFKNIAASYLWKIDSLESTLKLLGNYNYKKLNSNNDLNAHYENLTNNDIHEINYSSASANNLSVKGDLRKNWANNWSLRAGFQVLNSNRISELETFASANIISSSDWDLSENILAGYLGFSKLFSSNIYLYMSLRAENTNIRGERSDLEEDVKKNYIDFFPYIFLSYQPKEKINWNLSYTRSIYRPAFSLMNNYSNRISDILYDVGNPLLRPHKPHLIELTARYKIHSAKLSYRFIPDMITEYYWEEDTITYHTNVNKGTAKTISLDYTLNGKVTNWWMANLYAYIGYTEMPESYNKKEIVHGISTLSNRLSFNKIGDFQLMFNYQSNNIWGNSYNKGGFWINLSYGTSFFNNTLGVDVGINDIFNNFRVRSQTKAPSLKYTFYANSFPRTIWFRISYNISTKQKVNKSQLQNDNQIINRL
jgi:hypothetical protein